MSSLATVARHRVPGLDGLRAMAVGAVLVFHTGIALPGGEIGVDLFMVLSGYLITTLLLGEQRSNGRIDVTAFYLRRALRLFPALITLCLALILVSAVVNSGNQFELNAGLFASCAVALLYLSDVALGWGAWTGFGADAPLVHTWSLAIEEHFYLLWAPLLAYVTTRIRVERLTKILLGLVLVMTVWTVVLSEVGGAGLTRIIYAPDTRGVGLVVGSAMACLLWQRGDRLALPRYLPWMALVAFLGLTPFSVFHIWAGRGLLLVAAVLSAVIIFGVLDTDSAFARVWEWEPARLVGQRAYGIYLWHLPVFHFISAERFDAPTPVLAVAKLVVTAVFVEASYRFVEQPALRLGAARLKRRAVTLSGER